MLRGAVFGSPCQVVIDVVTMTHAVSEDGVDVAERDCRIRLVDYFGRVASLKGSNEGVQWNSSGRPLTASQGIDEFNEHGLLVDRPISSAHRRAELAAHRAHRASVTWVQRLVAAISASLSDDESLAIVSLD